MNKQDQFAIENFDRLPNLMRVSVRVVATLANTTPNTIWADLREGRKAIPEPLREGVRTTWTVGQIRTWLAGATAQQVVDEFVAEKPATKSTKRTTKPKASATAQETETC